MKLIKLFCLCLIASKTSQAQTIPNYVPLVNLEAWLPFEGNYDDMSGKSNDATNYGTTYTTDRCGKNNSAIYFNGNYQKLVIQNNILPDTPTSFSIAFWVKKDTSSIHPEIINDRGTNSYSHKYRITLGRPNSSWGFNYRFMIANYATNNISNLTSDSSISNDWEHVVVTYDKTTQTKQIYRNAILIATGNSSSYPAITTATTIGYSTSPNQNTNTDEPFKGSLDDIGFWSRSLDVKEIIKLYNGGCNNTSINNSIYKNDKLSVYPNPSAAVFTLINNSFDNMQYRLKIINNLGQTVYQKDHNTQTAYVDLGRCNSGVYYVYLIDNKNAIRSIKEIILK